VIDCRVGPFLFGDCGCGSGAASWSLIVNHRLDQVHVLYVPLYKPGGHIRKLSTMFIQMTKYGHPPHFQETILTDKTQGSIKNSENSQKRH
jgi:hypothetical protein